MLHKQPQTKMLACDFCAIPPQQKLNSCKLYHYFCDGCAAVPCFDQEGASFTACSFCPKCAMGCAVAAAPQALPVQPSEFNCPITLEIMVDPVVLGDGFSYERVAIEEWMEFNNHSPMTGLRIGKTVMPNTILRMIINEWKGNNGL